MNKLETAIEKINKTIGTNNNPAYNSHLYWSQKPYNICDILIENLTEKGDVICDPFMGSGVTVFESLKEEYSRRPIGIEINDYPIYLIKTLLSDHNIGEFTLEANKLINVLLKKENEIYNSTCKFCGSHNIIEKSMFEYDEKKHKIIKKVFFRCKSCGEKNEAADKEDSLRFHQFDSDDFKFFKNIDLIPDSRIAVKEDETLYDIFTKRNIKAIDTILECIENTKYKNLYIYSLIGVMHLCKITDPKSSSQWPLWTPNKDCVEKNVFKLFYKSLKKTIDALKYANLVLPRDRKEAKSFSELNENKYMIIKEGTQYVSDKIVPDESVDLIITDPPYMGQVIYSEYMQLYKPFLKTEIEYNKEILVVKTKERTKTQKDFFDDLNSAFSQISRMLKTDKYLCMYFHDANLKIWSNLINVMSNNNLQFEAITHVSKGKSTLKNIVSPKKSMNGDALLFFKKQVKDIEVCNMSMDDEIIKVAKNIIENNGGKATTAQLYDNGVLDFIIKKGVLDLYSKNYSDLTELFIKYLAWDESGYWRLMG